MSSLPYVSHDARRRCRPWLCAPFRVLRFTPHVGAAAAASQAAAACSCSSKYAACRINNRSCWLLASGIPHAAVCTLWNHSSQPLQVAHFVVCASVGAGVVTVVAWHLRGTFCVMSGSSLECLRQHQSGVCTPVLGRRHSNAWSNPVVGSTHSEARVGIIRCDSSSEPCDGGWWGPFYNTSVKPIIIRGISQSTGEGGYSSSAGPWARRSKSRAPCHGAKSVAQLAFSCGQMASSIYCAFTIGACMQYKLHILAISFSEFRSLDASSTKPSSTLGRAAQSSQRQPVLT